MVCLNTKFFCLFQYLSWCEYLICCGSVLLETTLIVPNYISNGEILANNILDNIL